MRTETDGMMKGRWLIGSTLVVALIGAFALTFAAFSYDARCEAEGFRNRALLGRVGGLLDGQVALRADPTSSNIDASFVARLGALGRSEVAAATRLAAK